MDKAEIQQAILDLLAEGDSMRTICECHGMPSRETVRLWQKEDADFDLAITCAREDGYEKRAEEAIESARNAEDAALGRLAFDADRWYLGKLSNAFSDNKPSKHEHAVDLSDEAKAWLGL